MKNLKKILTIFVTCAVSTTFAANGAAAVVAKTAGKSYSEPTRKEFLNGCQENVEAPICECVLKKLESKYDENRFKSLEMQLTVGVEDPDYINFIVNATTECSISGNASASQQRATNSTNSDNFQISSEDIALFKAMLDSPLLKDGFVQSCTVESMEWLGANQAEKTCKCAYDRLIKDNTLLSQMMTEDENLEDFDKWGFSLMEPCLPKQFPAEMNNAFIKECMKSGDVSKATCECVLKSIKKDYTVKTLIKAAFEESEKFELDIAMKAAQCLTK